jgi:hypothetical protein
MAKQSKVRKTTAKVIGAVPHSGASSVLWNVRLTAPYLPFYLDSVVSYETKERAEEEAKKWRKRTITLEIRK